MTAVDVERLLSAWLRDEDIDDDFDDGLLDLLTYDSGERVAVFTELPAKNKPFPCVRVTLLDERDRLNVPGLLYLSDSLVQVDVWGGRKVEAREIADLIRARLAAMRNVSTDLGVVTGVKFGTYSYLPDDDFEPAKPRYRFDVDVFAHPARVPSSP